MRKGLMALVCVACWGAPAWAAVEVEFGDLNQYSDMGDSRWERERHAQVLREYVESRAARLPAGQLLKVSFKDVNLAGEMEPWGWRHERLRILRQVGAPTLELSFSLTEGGRVVKEGEARLRDLDYLSMRIPASLHDQALKHEKQLLNQWFEREFGLK